MDILTEQRASEEEEEDLLEEPDGHDDSWAHSQNAGPSYFNTSPSKDAV